MSDKSTPPIKCVRCHAKRWPAPGTDPTTFVCAICRWVAEHTEKPS